MPSRILGERRTAARETGNTHTSLVVGEFIKGMFVLTVIIGFPASPGIVLHEDR
jgi:hypothetical protein